MGLTRKERLRLPKSLRFKKTVKQRQIIKKYPRRKFAVIDMSPSGNKLPFAVRQANVKAVLSQKKSANRYHKCMKGGRKDKAKKAKMAKMANKDKDKQKA